MTNKKFDPEELIQKYVTGKCTEEEKAIIESWHLHELRNSNYRPSAEHISDVYHRMGRKLALHTGYDNFYEKTTKFWPRMALAASVLFVISIAGFFYLNSLTPQATVVTTPSENDITPGVNKAMLTLSNGKKIELSSNSHQISLNQDGVSISKTTDGILTYHKLKEIRIIATNKLETPRGGQYRVTLPDGTKVWLNAASKLIYPTAFIGNERKVQLSGEAYFEVAKNRSKPFRIISNNQTVEVLGTHFNINAYPDDKSTKTTLLEGSVKIYKAGQSKLLKPGQVSTVDPTGIEINAADTERNIAWKNNEFIFNGETLESIMKIVCRWYDVEVNYAGPPDQTKYWGVVSRSKNISAVLKMLESTGRINFKIKGRRIIVMN